MRYVGRAPDADYSVVTRKYTDDRYDTIRVDAVYISQEVATQAADLVTPAYVDTQDALRARKTAVDAADAGYLLQTQVGATNGLAPLDNNAYIPNSYLPTVQTERKIKFAIGSPVLGPTTTRVVTSTNAKEYLAAQLVIPDPGYPFVPLIFAAVRGGSLQGVAASRSMGTGSFGQLSVLRASDDLRYSWGLGTARTTYAHQWALPFANSQTNPTNRPSLNGQQTFNLYLSLFSGSTYTFHGESLTFYALVIPGI